MEINLDDVIDKAIYKIKLGEKDKVLQQAGINKNELCFVGRKEGIKHICKKIDSIKDIHVRYDLYAWLFGKYWYTIIIYISTW